MTFVLFVLLFFSGKAIKYRPFPHARKSDNLWIIPGGAVCVNTNVRIRLSAV